MRPIFWDLETTGLRADRDRIVEIAGYDPTSDRSFSSLINPGMLIPEDSTKVHGITDEMVSSAPTFAAVIEQWNEFCSGDVIMIAHNGDNFDMRFLAAEYKRAGATLPVWKTIDTLKWSRRYRPDLPKHQLQFLREVYGIPENQAHRALDDVKTLAAVFSAMVDDLPWPVVFNLLQTSG